MKAEVNIVSFTLNSVFLIGPKSSEEEIDVRGFVLFICFCFLISFSFFFFFFFFFF